jgi:hypothetical protein
MVDGSKYSLTVMYPVSVMSMISILPIHTLQHVYRVYSTENGQRVVEFRGHYDQMISVLSTLTSEEQTNTWGQCCTVLLRVRSGDLVLQEDTTGKLRLMPLYAVVALALKE